MNREYQSPNPFVFLSYARDDFPLVSRLRNDLGIHGIRGWTDQTTYLSGNPDEEEELRVAIRDALAVVLVVSTKTRRSRSVKEEIAIAQMYQRRSYLFWMEGNRLEDVIPTSCKQLPSFDARGQRYPLALQDLVQVVGQPSQSTPVDLLQADKTAPLVAAPRNPYKGLRAFSKEDAGDFFGRDHLIAELVEQVRQKLTTSTSDEDGATGRLLTVLGPSGSGKSSLVMAGLIPRLQQGALPGSQYWAYPDAIVPGAHPLETLGLTLTSLFPQLSPGNILLDLQDDATRGLHVLLASYVQESDRHVILVIDQFEELFTQTTSAEERQRFLDLLLTATTEPSGPLFAILTMRADFYDRLLLYPELGRMVMKHQVPVYPLNVQELRAVIERPARLPDVQVAFEGNLVGDLLFDIQGQAGALPLLQFTLDHLFQRRQGPKLTLHAYQQIGGVRGALVQHAERIYQSLPSPNHQQLVQALFSRLIDPGTLETDATKRRIPLSEFTLTDPAKTAMLAKVIETFTNERLLTINTIGNIPMVEVSHEALIGAWTRLREWLHMARDTIHLQQTINTDATDWEQHAHSPDRLYRGTQLKEALLWRDTNIPNTGEEAFLQASLKAQHRTTRRRIVISAAVVAGMIGSGLLVYLLRPSSSSRIIPPTPQPKSLPYAYKGHSAPVLAVAWSPDGQRIASAGADKIIQIWDVSSGAHLSSCTGHTNTVNTVAWSPDGKRIASASVDKTIQVWDASTGSHLLTYTGHTDVISSAVWSPDSKRIASASHDKTVHVWDVSRDTHPIITYMGHTSWVDSVAWSPDGTRIASASEDKTVHVWDANNGSLLATYIGHTDAVYSVVWSPDSKRIASAGLDETVQVWDASSGSHLLTYPDHTAIVRSVDWSSDGKRTASAGSSKTVQIWDSANGIPLFSYTGHTDAVNNALWSPNSTRMASASDDNTVQIWDVSSGSRFLTYTGHAATVTSVAWSPDGKHIASASDDSTAHVWDASTATLLFSYTLHKSIVTSVVWSPDGTLIASASWDKTVQVWYASRNTRLFSYTGHTDIVNSVAWSPDGIRIASAGKDTTVQVWYTSNRTRLLTYTGHAATVTSVAWSPDGKRIASASDDKTVQTWNASTGTPVVTYTHHTNSVNSVAWSPDGKRIASASDDKTVHVWDASNGTPLITYSGHSSPVLSVAWSPDGKRIASASQDKTVHVWDSSNGTRLFSYTGHTSIVYSVAWSPEGLRIASASDDKTVQVWWML